ncbi:hypothetical protein [Piscinibacter sp.]|uniref:hypothetical protein n=1 Tax=Piscinibacter sp. TaxID=1903157 RepID=UPI00355AB704
MALSACGGAPDIGETPMAAAAADSQERVTAFAASAADASPVGASGAAIEGVALPRGTAHLPAPAVYDIRLVDHNGWHREAFELVPVRGAGYQTLHAIVVLRGPSALSPVAGVEPYCATALRCEYVPPRNGNYAERYTVSLSDDSVAQLSTTNGMIAISARHLEVEQPSIVSVTLTVDGQPPVTKRITYAKSP